MIVKSVLGADFFDLPPELQRFHSGQSDADYVGTVDVTRGSRLAGVLCQLGGFPAAGAGVPLRMTITGDDAQETWSRDFAGQRLVSVMRRLDAQHVIERFGPFEAIMRPRVRDGALEMPVVRMRVLGLPVPRPLTARGGGRETVSPDGSIQFHVYSSLPLLGPMISYTGNLAQEAAKT